jgi:glycyl-tRNA synthetase alpha chain
MMEYQQMIANLQNFWSDYGCVIVQPYNSEVGAGTFNPNTFLRALGPEPWQVAYVEPSKRPKDGRYLESLRSLGIKPAEHDIRFVEDDWESPTLGAAGLGWEVWLDGMEVSQFTYFQQVGGVRCKPVSVELTYGLLRLCMFIQEVDHLKDILWGGGLTWGEVMGQFEREYSAFNFEHADVAMYRRQFDEKEAEARALLEAGLVHPGFDAVIKCSHVFNVLEARGAISVTERTGFITRVRNLARAAARGYVTSREDLGFPLLKEQQAE